MTRADGAKTWLWGNAMRAAEVVLDPELTIALPAALTAGTGVDALVHAVEAATNRYANAANNLYADAAIGLAARHLERAVSHPKDIPAREGMQRAAMLAGIAIDNGSTGIAHNIGHAMGSLRKIHHGRAVGVALLAALPWNIETDDGRYAACATAMGAKASSAGFAEAYERLLRACGLKISVARNSPASRRNVSPDKWRVPRTPRCGRRTRARRAMPISRSSPSACSAKHDLSDPP